MLLQEGILGARSSLWLSQDTHSIFAQWPSPLTPRLGVFASCTCAQDGGMHPGDAAPGFRSSAFSPARSLFHPCLLPPASTTSPGSSVIQSVPAHSAACLLSSPPIGCCPKAGTEYMVDPQQTFAEFIFVCNFFLLLACGSRR